MIVRRFCFAHGQFTSSLTTCIFAGWRNAGPCDVDQAEIVRVQQRGVA